MLLHPHFLFSITRRATMKLAVTVNATPPPRPGHRLAVCALATALTLLLAACGSAPSPQESGSAPETPVATPSADSSLSSAAERYLRQVSAEDETIQRLQAAELAIGDGDADAAALLLGPLNPPNLALAQQARYGLSLAGVAMLRNHPEQAIQVLLGNIFLDSQLSSALQRRHLTMQAEAYYAANRHLAAARALSRRAALMREDEIAANNNEIWRILSAAPVDTLTTRDPLVDSYELRGWLELLEVTNRHLDQLDEQIAAIERWRERWNQHSAVQRLPDSLAFLVALRDNRPQRVALLLPLQNAAGDAVSQGFMAAYYDAIAQGLEAPEISIHDTSGRSSSEIMALYHRAAGSGVDLIIGPMDKDTVRNLQQQRELPVTTLALNYGDDGRTAPSQLFQFGLAPEDEIRQTANMAWQAGYQNAAVMTPATADHDRLQQFFVDYWHALGGEVVSRASYGSSSSYSELIRRMFSIDDSEARAARLRDLLPRNNINFVPRRRQDIDFLFLIATPGDGRQLRPTLGFHYAGDVPVYALPSIYDGGLSPAANRDLDGVIFSDAPWILRGDDPLRLSLASAWSPASGAVERLRAMGVDSYRLIYRLSQLANFPEARFHGATGLLSLASDGSIRRELPAARIVDGSAQPIPTEQSDAETSGEIAGLR
jgi:outer membrane PBP1 activator LpoA protein